MVTFDPEELLVSPDNAEAIGLKVPDKKPDMSNPQSPPNPADPLSPTDTANPPTPSKPPDEPGSSKEVKGIESYDAEKLPANGAFQMTVGEYFTKIPKHRIYYEAGYEENGKADLDELKESADQTSVIFPQISLVKQLFGSRVTEKILGTKDEDRIFEGQKVVNSPTISRTLDIRIET